MIKFTLSNGVEMPALGIGTFMLSPQQAEFSVETALKNGYSLVDTANAYMNEKAVGRGIKNSGRDRKELFISSKLWPSVYEKEGAVDKSLELLDIDYIDLMFIHQPSGNFMAGYRQIEQAYKDGKVKAIGISNFQGEKLEKLLAECEIKPHVIQVEAHPYYTQDVVRERLLEYGTVLMAWYPLGSGNADLIREEIFTQLAEKYSKTPVQIILRWHTQMGFVAIPGSKSENHIKENIDIFDFELTKEEMEQIAEINKNRRFFNQTAEMEENYVNFVIDLDSQP